MPMSPEQKQCAAIASKLVSSGYIFTRADHQAAEITSEMSNERMPVLGSRLPTMGFGNAAGMKALNGSMSFRSSAMS